jgi:hypothetical protein
MGLMFTPINAITNYSTCRWFWKKRMSSISNGNLDGRLFDFHKAFNSNDAGCAERPLICFSR